MHDMCVADGTHQTSS